MHLKEEVLHLFSMCSYILTFLNLEVLHVLYTHSGNLKMSKSV